MKKIGLKTACTLLGAMLLFSSCIIACSAASSAPDTPKVDVDAIDKVIVDCRSAEAFAKTSTVYEHIPTQAEPDPLTGGKYSFSPTMKAMQVEYHAGARLATDRYRVMIHFNNKDTVSTEYRYWVIVYAAKTNTPYTLTLWNGGGKGEKVIVTENGTDTKGKFIVSEPFDIHKPGADGQSSLTRWAATVHCTINFNTSSPDAKFFIKEYAFFKSAEDAKAYYNSVDINQNPPSENTVISTDPWCEPGEGLIHFSYNKLDEPAVISTKTPIPEITDEEPTAEPVIMSFESKEAFEKNSKFITFDNPMGGYYEFVTLDDGTSCLKLNHNYYKDWINDYRMMPAFKFPYTLTNDHKYMRVVYMSTDRTNYQLNIWNNATGQAINLTNSAAYSNGQFLATNPVDISNGGYLERLVNGIHCTIGYNSRLNGSEIYIKEISFFTTAKQAYDYYGDAPYDDSPAADFSELTFGTKGNTEAWRDQTTYGQSHDIEDALVITQGTKTRFGSIPFIEYGQMIRGKANNQVKAEYRYLRVLYSAKHPEGIEKASMAIVNFANDTKFLLSGNIVNTNGEYILTEPAYVSPEIMQRFNNKIASGLFINTNGEGGEYRIKAIYFFNTRKDAEKFEIPADSHSLSINGNDISKYQIVIAKDSPINVVYAAKSAAEAIKDLTAVEVPIVTDDMPVSEYEILIGESTRPLSYKCFEDLRKKSEFNYKIYVENNNLIITSPMGIAVPYAVTAANDSFFYLGKTAPAVIDINSTANLSAQVIHFNTPTIWEAGDPVHNPEVVTVNFDTNEGYYNEDNGERNFKYENGKYTVNATSFASSYMHLYEKNVNYKATLIYRSENKGSMGIMFRVNDVKSYVKAGYDFAAGEWYIESRDSADYYTHRIASKKATVAPNTPYEVAVEVMYETVTLKVNGETVLEGIDPGHYSPGRLGLYAENANVAFDDVEAILVSGQGTVIKNVTHTKLPDEMYREGGSVLEMKDGSLYYLSHYANSGFTSNDKGYSWQRAEAFTEFGIDYPTIMRLNDGSIMKIKREYEGAYENNKVFVCYISTDEGKTFNKVSEICPQFYPVTWAQGGNMNDKLMQTASGRLLWGVTYQSSTPVDGKTIFCCYYFSEDNGKTWWKSNTDSWTIPGNEDIAAFGENKMLECADGTIRMYNSWAPYGYIVYSDSTDGGKTFGPLQIMDTMYTPNASCAFVRDVYADNDYTYYMVWVNRKQATTNTHAPRTCLSLAKTTDGKNWEFIGDIMRWECTYAQGTGFVHQIVDPFITVTEDYIYCGTGFSDGMRTPGEGGYDFHFAQRQHIYSIRKDTLPEGKEMSKFADVPKGSNLNEAVVYVSETGLIPGVSETAFEPFKTMSGDEFAAVIGRLANGIDTSAVAGAEAVTAEQACAILAKCANYTGTAKAVDWAIENGIYTSTIDNLDPTAPATRGLIAIMLYNYSEVFSK